jgi:hypothetical protein
VIIGANGYDFMHGQQGNDYMDGGQGNDEIHGNGDNDSLIGGAGIDYLYGDDGFDYVDGGNGYDYLYGGAGDDTMVAGYDSEWNYMDGGSGNDLMYGGNGIDYMHGGDGQDTLYGGAGNDELDGGDDGYSDTSTAPRVRLFPDRLRCQWPQPGALRRLRPDQGHNTSLSGAERGGFHAGGPTCLPPCEITAMVDEGCAMDEESLFAAALDRPAGPDRREFLDRACGDDVALRKRVDRLLAAHVESFELLDRLPASTRPSGPLVGGDGDAWEGDGSLVGGRYTLLERVGSGGMGTVWAAEQAVPVRRRVALKLIKPGMDSLAVLARFEAERQALAMMDHPNIARVLDGGTTDGGRPFFVMDFVEGVPLTRYCDDSRLGLGQRLALFVEVCRAVQHAHTKGIVHRDLKPGNILVGLQDGRPVPKVIDFGWPRRCTAPSPT